MHAFQARELAKIALDEDLASGDLTTEATVAEETTATGIAVAKAPLVVCGADLFFAAFSLLDADAVCIRHLPEGHVATAGEPIWSVSGNARALLLAERSALNLAQRASGIATAAKRYVDALPAGSTTRITDTRKTAPGLRLLDRYAVRTGGAHNHRDNLGAAVMIKDNHIVAAGGIAAAVARARYHAPHTCKLEVEVESLEMLTQALNAGADIVMLDNFDERDIPTALQMSRGRAQVEVSGGITLERVRSLAHAGVDVISVGALTHSAAAADISLRLEINP